MTGGRAGPEEGRQGRAKRRWTKETALSHRNAEHSRREALGGWSGEAVVSGRGCWLLWLGERMGWTVRGLGLEMGEVAVDKCAQLWRTVPV